MVELRKHYFLEEYCIIAPERNRRPSDLSAHDGSEISESSVQFSIKGGSRTEETCPFCPGNEDRTPPANAAYVETDSGGLGVYQDNEGETRRADWKIRCFNNLYPAFTRGQSVENSTYLTKSSISSVLQKQSFCETGGALLRQVSRTFGSQDLKRYAAPGSHEVIVETPDHYNHPSDLSDKDVIHLFEVYRQRYEHYMGAEDIVFTSIFRNHGREAGASLSHPHTQLVAMPVMPPALCHEIDAIEAKGSCPYCEIISAEEESERLIIQNEGWAVIAPFFSKAPFEFWILPTEHHSSMLDFDGRTIKSLALTLREMLGRLKLLLNDPPYNYALYQICGRDDYHFNLRVRPKLTTPGGYEMNTDIHINPLSPEQAAEYLRKLIT